mgnify:FL=1
MAYSPPMIDAPVPGVDVSRLRRRLDVYEARLAAILDENDTLASNDPARGARCIRGDMEGPSMALVCPGCWLNPIHGERKEAANAVCRGVLATAQARIEMHRALGDEVRARQLEEWIGRVPN